MKDKDPCMIDKDHIEQAQDSSKSTNKAKSPVEVIPINAPIFVNDKEIKDNKALLTSTKNMLTESEVQVAPQLKSWEIEPPIASKNPFDDDFEPKVADEPSKLSIAKSAAPVRKPPACPPKPRTPLRECQVNNCDYIDQDTNDHYLAGDVSGLLDVPSSSKGGLLSGSLTPRSLRNSIDRVLTPRRGSSTPRQGSLTPRGGGGHSFQRLQ